MARWLQFMVQTAIRSAVGRQGGGFRLGKDSTMNITYLIGWIVIGIVAGWLAGLITKEDHSVWGDLVLGLLGAVVAGVVVSGLGQEGNFILSIVAATVGAIVLVILKNLIVGRNTV
jgi:uncharacterized membrane protein YeaQ/YmgE (transglycosylase-associated protein family)